MVEFRYIEDSFQGESALLTPQFDVCKGNPQVFNLMRIQCKLNIEYDDINGPIINDENHKILCREAIKLAKSEQVDVFITPEYSIPYSIINEIAEDNTGLMRPEKRKIWCLCCEGCKLDFFRNSLDMWEGMGINIIRDALNTVIANNFVDALIYIFRLENNTLCFAPQLKTHPMSDKDLNCEENGMCLGQIIFKIGKNKNNQLCTIICADSLNSRYICLNKIFQVGNENLILMHPQMNPKPRYDSFKELRQNLYSNVEGNNLIYITANCAFGTELKSIDTSDVSKIKNPWSCIYIKNRHSDWLDRHRTLRSRNIIKGMRYGFLVNLKLDIWYSIKEENIQIMKIIKPRGCGASVTMPNVLLLVNKLYKPSTDRLVWNEMDNYCYDDNIKDLIAVDCDEYKYPLTANKEQRDKFFGLCFGDTELGELAIDKDEVCELLSMHVDEECEEKRRDRLNNYPVLINCLNDPKLPKEFGILVDNHMLTLEDDIFNLVSSNSEDERRIIVAYANNEKEAKRIESAFRDLIGYRLYYAKKNGLTEEIKYLEHGSNRVNYCIFTKQYRTAKIITYPNFDNSITAKERLEDLTSIKR